MIKANELRVGNYLKFNGSIHKIGYEAIKIFSDFGNDIRGIIPIKITKKWLLSAGFIEYSKNQDEYYKKVYEDDDLNYDGRVRYLYIYANLEDKKEPYFCLIFDISNENCKPDYNGISNMKTYEYVHELQNLYFALTGSELVFSTEP